MIKRKEKCSVSSDGKHSWCKCPKNNTCQCGLTICILCNKEKIDQDNKTIKRIFTGESKLNSIFKRIINVGQFQPYRDIDPLEIGNKLYVIYSDEQLWSVSKPITEIDYEYKEENHD